MSIICGTDLSEASRGALAVARALAAQRGDRELVLVHVVERDDDVEPAASVLEARRSQLAALAAGAEGVAVRVEVLVGAPDDALAGLAEAERASLLIVAAQSHGDRQSKLGHTAANIIVRTHVPVIAVRDPAPWLAFARREAPLKVLLGIDDSATCELGVQWTLALAALGPVEVVLGAIYYPDDAAAHYGLPARGMVDADPEVERLMERDLIRRFKGTAGDLPAAVRARARRGLGRIGDHLIELATEERVDAIVVGTSQKTGLGRLGSVSSVITEDAPQSVVCVPPQAAVATYGVPLLRQVLVATDLSPFANRAVPYAFALTAAAAEAAEVHILHVVKDDAEIDEAALLRKLVALAPVRASQQVHAHIMRGDDPATVIAQSAARYGVDAIAIASHGRSGLSRALVGSVADRLLRATRLPVLVLRPS